MSTRHGRVRASAGDEGAPSAAPIAPQDAAPSVQQQKIEFGSKPVATVSLPQLADQAQAAAATQNACRLIQERPREALSVQANSSAQRAPGLLS